MGRRPLPAAVALVAATALMLIPLSASASSHREAPLIAEDPLADNTDVYAFVDPADNNRVVLAADYDPFQPAANGPNFSRFGDDVHYKIHVDNVGDGQDHIVFSFKFHTCTVNPDTILYNSPPAAITADGTSSCTAPDGAAVSVPYKNWNRPQSYDVSVTSGQETIGSATNMPTPPDVVGAVGTPKYHSLAKKAVRTFGPDVKVFAGLRDDPFFINVGGVFDLLNLTGAPAGGTDNLAGLNVRSIVLSVPKSLLKGPNDSVIGVWATASRNAVTVRTDATALTVGIAQPPFRTPAGFVAPGIQVSRLGNPLMNEVIVELGRKNLYNASVPKNDSQFEGRLLEPELAKLLNAVFGLNAPEHNRTDLAAIFLTGIKDANQPKSDARVKADELRLNMDVPSKHSNPNDDNGVGFLGPDGNGFPNGRRLADDVVDIELRAVDGLTCPIFQKSDPSACNGQGPGAMAATLGDGVPKNDVPFMCVFPYLADPHSPTPTAGSPKGSSDMSATECPQATAAGPPPTPAAPPATTLAQTGLTVMQPALPAWMFLLLLGMFAGLPFVVRRTRR